MAEDVLQGIIRHIVGTAQPQKIVLLGGRARGVARPDSDFDLLASKESSEPGCRRDAPSMRFWPTCRWADDRKKRSPR